MEGYDTMVANMRDVFNSGVTKTKAWRVSQLEATIRCLTEQKQQILKALKDDLNKDEYDALTDEIGFCLNEAHWFINNLDRLMKDRKQKVDMINLGGKAYVHYEPFGVVLNITAWNYPIQIAFSSMLSILAAGNCVVLKPSEISEHTSRLMAQIIPRYFDDDCVKVVEGAVPETTALLKERWDHIMYTGNGAVGKIIYKAAAEHLTPCTLELGGKCPAYISAGCNLDAVCNRICWAKYKNAGQTCISVDYVLVDAAVEREFLDTMAKIIMEQYTATPATCEGYCRIISDRHFKRLQGLMDASPERVVRIGGDSVAESRYIAPTVLSGVSPDDRIMQEEVFGPILPVLSVKDHSEAIKFINKREKALHVYVFSQNQAIIDECMQRTSSGGFSANDCIVFRVERGLPFGGVGASGFGCYGGDGGFENFSHKKSVLIKSQGMEWLYKMMRYSPHTPEKMWRIQMIQELPLMMKKIFKGLAILIPLGILIGVVMYYGINAADKVADL